MKFKTEVKIEVPREKVVNVFDDPSNLAKWQPGLVIFEQLEGEPGKTGSKTKMVYKLGSGKTEMIETIIARELPDKFSATYEAKGVFNRIDNYFVKYDDCTTIWRLDACFEFTGFYRLMGWFLQTTFKKQTKRQMLDFKEFVEKEEGVDKS